QQLERDTGSVSSHLAFLLASSIPGVTTNQALRDLGRGSDLSASAVALESSLQNINAATLFDASGMVDASSPQSASSSTSLSLPDLSEFRTALSGQTNFELNEPG